MKEPTKKDVLDIAEYLGCNGGELWSEVSKLLKQQNDYAEQQLLTEIMGELPEKFVPEANSEGDKYITDTKDGWNRAIDQVVAVIKQRMGSSQDNTTPTVLGHEADNSNVGGVR